MTTNTQMRLKKASGGLYEVIYDPYAESYVVKDKKDYYLVSRRTRVILAGPYPFISANCYDTHLFVDTDGKYGYLTPDGKVMISAVYDSAGTFNENGFANVRQHGEWVKIERDGIPVGPIDCEDETKEKPSFRFNVGDTVKFSYKDGICSGVIDKVNDEKETFTVILQNGKKISRYWRMVVYP